MRKLIEVAFQSLDGVVDAPDIVQEAQPYFLSDPEHENYARERLFAADALLLGRKTYEAFAEWSYAELCAGYRLLKHKPGKNKSTRQLVAGSICFLDSIRIVTNPQKPSLSIFIF